MVNILHITTWYPNEYDPQLGIFIQKHVRLGHPFANNVVLAIVPSEKIKKQKIVKSQKDHVIELVGYYPTRRHKSWSNYRHYNRLLIAMMQEFLALDIMPDAINCHVGEKSLSIAEKFFKHVPRVLTEHWSGYLDGRFNELSTFAQKKRIRQMNRCKAIVCVSDVLQNKIKSLGIEAPISIIPNVIEFKGIKTQANEDLRFLVVADLVDKVKNISGIIDAFNTYHSQNPTHTLTIIGDGTDREMLESKAASNKNIEFIGRKDNEFVLENLPKYDCLIVNSRHETFSMITAEALLSGVPVIATKCGGPEQFVQHKENGFLVDLDQQEQLLEGLLWIKGNVQIIEYKNLNLNILKKIDPSKVSNGFSNIYQEII